MSIVVALRCERGRLRWPTAILCTTTGEQRQERESAARSACLAQHKSGSPACVVGGGCEQYRPVVALHEQREGGARRRQSSA